MHDQEATSREHTEADDKPLEAVDENAEDGQEQHENDDLALDAGQEAIGDNYSGMNFGDMNQMQMMMAMQNGMNPAAFASFPMMGEISRPPWLLLAAKRDAGMNMGMDPMAMQNVFMNGGFGTQGMGMNGMNMNMGMNGFSGGNNDWSGQQSWNVGQDNFNPSAAGMGNGDFGNFNSGFRNGYNPGNYGHNQYNDFGRGGYGFRGRGRGRGFYRGFGRGYHQGNNPRHFGQEMWAQQMAQNGAGGDMQQDPNSAATLGQGQDTNTDEFGRTVRPDTQLRGEGVELTGDDETRTGGTDGEEKHMASGNSHEAAGDYTAAQNGDVSADSAARARSQGRGYGPPSAAADVPLNAPTGPKAMRQGLPNTSALHLRARGFMTDQPNPMSASNGSSVQSPLEDMQASRSSSQHPKETTDLHQPERGRDRDYEKERARRRDDDKDIDGTGPGPRSRSRSQDRKESRRHRRHRSESVSNDEHADDSRRRRHKSRRSTRDDVDKSRSKDDKTERSRSASPERERTRDRDRDHKRSSHRSHRDRDREKEKESDYDRHDRHRKSGRRSRHGHDRDRDREHERDRKERPRDRDRDRERERDRDRDREHRHRNRRTSVDPPTLVEAASADFNPPTGPRSGLSIRGTGSKSSGLEAKGESGNNKSSSSQRREVGSSRRGSQASIGAPKGPSSSKDVHTLEREARDRERLLKEAQRMAGLAGLAGLKRNRDGGDDRSGRRKSRRSEAVYDDEERMRRLEDEREGGRWD